MLGLCAAWGLAQQPGKDQNVPKPAGAAQAGSEPQTETIPAPQPAQAPQPAKPPGFLEPAQAKALAHKIWLAAYRVDDLLTQVHPEKWKTSDVARNSFNQTLDNLHKALAGLEAWRAQFENRPDSMYFGFETYASMNAILPRLDGVARAVTQYENPSLGAQYSQAANQLFDLQQVIEPYIAYLLRNPDETLYVAQTNLAGCQSELGNALRGQSEPAKPLKNTFVQFYPRRPRNGHVEDQAPPQGGNKPPSGNEKKAEPPSGKTPPSR